VSRSGFHPIVRRRRMQLAVINPLLHSFIRSPFVKRIAILFLVFFLMIGLPATVALVFRHSARANIETWLHTSDASIEVSVWHTDTGQASMMSLNDYILGVLAAEFHPDTPVDALKAGAVACRTYIIREKTVHSTTQTVAGTHGADVTDSGAIDMPFMSQADMNKKYGVAAPTFLTNLRSAIQSTDGLILTYQKKPILAFTTLVTPGSTRDATDVIGSPVPYLKSTPCPADKTASGRVHVLVFKQSAIAKALQMTNIDLKNLKVVTTDKLGYVQSVSYGKTIWSGAKFAALLGLPSSNFTFSVGAGGGTGAGSGAGGNAQNVGQLSVTTSGVGSGLGMSLNEASALAESGQSWTTILNTFYPGTTRELDTDFEV
jgi:stage II sporulation protein D